MSRSDIQRLSFRQQEIDAWSSTDPRHKNWPVVYVLDEPGRGTALRSVYVGESLNAATRMRQHLKSSEKRALKRIRVIVDETYNKSVCLDLESYLIRMLSGDGAFQVLNRNDGITDAEYFDRSRYRERFQDVFQQLKDDGVFTRTIPQIENSDLFKLSPFKALSIEQSVAVNDVLEHLSTDLAGSESTTTVIHGEPGTGKTVVAIFLLKLIADIARSTSPEDVHVDSMFSEFFAEGAGDAFRGLRVALVVPQQSLRNSVKRVFRRTPGLKGTPVLTPFEVGESDGVFDLLIVDETHRLSRRASQPSGLLNTKFGQINIALFGSDDVRKTQLDWLIAKSRHRIFLLDALQTVRPADLDAPTVRALTRTAADEHRLYRLTSQMRVKSTDEYVNFVREMLGGSSGHTVPRSKPDLGDYELRLFDDVEEMRQAVLRKDASMGLARMVAGYAWQWHSKRDRDAWDIKIGAHRYRWNSTVKEWISSARALEEIGSIHTVQGYDLNYAGVIIGPDLRLDAETGRVHAHRESYFDRKGKDGNPTLGTVVDDDDLRVFIVNIYAVLMTRGMRGTYLYVCDPALRERIRRLLPG